MARLELLSEAHFRARWLIVATITVGWGGQVAGSYLVPAVVTAEYDSLSAMSLRMLVVAGFVYLAIAYRCARTIALVKGKGGAYVAGLTIASAVLTLVTPCFLGWPGCAVLQHVTEGEFRRAGVRIGPFGARRADIEARIDEARAASVISPPPPGEPAGN